MKRERVASLVSAIEAVTLDGDWAEFGVASGVSARFLLERMPSRTHLWLFDWFGGLLRDWGPCQKGKYACKPPEFADDRVTVIKGLFEDTLDFWKCGRGPLALVHIDCDTYEATTKVLAALREIVLPGTIFAFDEFLSFGDEERLAWQNSGLRGDTLFADQERAVLRLTV